MENNFKNCFIFIGLTDNLLMKKRIIILIISCLSFVLLSCVSIGVENQKCSRLIAGSGVKNAAELTMFFCAHNPSVNRSYINEFANIYISEAKKEGINWDVAFVQMCLETGFLRFGNLVTPEMHNYCGLGAIDASHPGEVFADERTGVRAHIQHLHAYGTTENVVLKNPLVDKRYKYVKPRGKAPTVFELSGTWASDRMYGAKLDSLLTQLESY